MNLLQAAGCLVRCPANNASTAAVDDCVQGDAINWRHVRTSSMQHAQCTCVWLGALIICAVCLFLRVTAQALLARFTGQSGGAWMWQ